MEQFHLQFAGGAPKWVRFGKHWSILRPESTKTARSIEIGSYLTDDTVSQRSLWSVKILHSLH